MAVITASAELRDVLRQGRASFAAGFAFHAVTELAALAYPIYMVQTFDRAVPSGSLATMLALFTGVVLVLVFKGVFALLRSRLAVQSTVRVDRALAERVFRALIERSATARDVTGAEALRDLTQFRQFFAGTGPTIAMSAPWAGLFVGMLFAVSPLVGVTAVTLVLVQIAAMLLNMRSTRAALEAAATTRAAAYRTAETNIRTADAAVAMGMVPGLVAAFERRNARALAAEATGGVAGSRFAAFEASYVILQQAVILTVAAIEVVRSGLPGGFAFAAIILFGFVQKPVALVIGSWEGYLQARAAGERLARLLEAMPPPRPSMPLPRPRGEILVKGVTHVPGGAGEPVLRGVGLHVEAGTALGVVGPIGSGKTTLARLLVGLGRPTAGEIRLDGAEVSGWDRDALGRHVGYLPQEIAIVPGTVAENVGRFGQHDADAVAAAAGLAGVADVVARLPRGYDTPIGEGGVPLSGGQRQLVALARAVVGAPALVVLDEPNSNLDGPGEAALLACLAALRARGATIILVSHRPSLIEVLDRVAILREGSIQSVVPAAEFRAPRTIRIRARE